MHPADDFFPHWLAPRRIGDEGRHQAAQVEAPVEPVGERSQVDLAALAVLQLVERTYQRSLEVAQYGADPLELGQDFRLEGAHHPGQATHRSSQRARLSQARLCSWLSESFISTERRRY
jgi:hypothetical protein